jgi:hypothetical protein
LSATPPSAPFDTARVPLLRDGSASLGRVINYRVVWAALALIVGIDSISLAISKGRDLGILRIILPGLLCAAAAAFALWQLWLIVTAARRVMRDGGAARLAGLTILGAALAALGIAGLLHVKAVPQLAELWDIHHGDERMSTLEIIVSEDGRTMILDGALGLHASREVADALDTNPAVRTIVVEGPGGRLGSAYQIARMIRARGLETRVDDECYSACTVMFLGGVRRGLGPSGKLGFHRAGFPGMDEAELSDANRQLRDFMTLWARVSLPFVTRVMATPHDSIWLPTRQALLDAGVIHHADERRK